MTYPYWKRKRTYRRRRKRQFKGVVRNQISRIPQFKNLNPSSMFLRDSYQTQLKLVPNATLGGASYAPHVCLFRAAGAGSIYNPISSGRESWLQLSGTSPSVGSVSSGSAPRGQYNHYYVMGAKMTVSFQPTANNQDSTYHDENNVQVACGLSRDALWPTANAAGGTTLQEITHATNSKSRQTFGNTMTGAVGNRVTMTQSYSPKRVLGISDTADNEDLKVKTADGVPHEETWFYIYLAGLNTGLASDPHTIPNYIINVKIDYLLKFTEVIDQVNIALNA